MKKIIIQSDTGKVRTDLVSHLKKLFPECEIQIITYQSKSIDERMTTGTTSFNTRESGKTFT